MIQRQLMFYHTASAYEALSDRLSTKSTNRKSIKINVSETLMPLP